MKTGATLEDVNEHRRCPFCDENRSTDFGNRGKATFRRCSGCASIFMDVSESDFRTLHDGAFVDDTFVSVVEASHGTQADRALWRWVDGLVGPGPILELGPGSGHLLAAAKASGREVFGVESSEVHRSYIRRTWGIEELCPSIDALPKGKQFGGIIAINTIEHVYDVVRMLLALRQHLLPTGRILISTCSADCIVLPLVGVYWAMFKPSDHVSIGSANGMEIAARRSKLEPVKVWSTELPLETPIGLMVAARDFANERLLTGLRRTATTRPDTAVDQGNRQKRDPYARRMKRSLMRIAAGIDPTSWLSSRSGRAASLKLVLRAV